MDRYFDIWTVLARFTNDTLLSVKIGPIEKIFNNRFVVPLGRLSYSVYLVNIMVMMMIESRQRASVYPTIELLVSKYICRIKVQAKIIKLLFKLSLI